VYRVFFIGKILLEDTGFCRNSHFPAGLVSREDVSTTESVLRHSASQNFSVGTYQQGIRDRILRVVERFAEDVTSGLPEISFEQPAEPKKTLRKDFFNPLGEVMVLPKVTFTEEDKA
jgi:hypothetical protein